MKKSIAAICAAALFALPGVAQAKAPTYEIAIKGTQVTTWNYNHVAQYACDATVTGAGSQDVPIVTGDTPLRVQLYRPKGMPALLAEPGDMGAKYGFAEPIELLTHAEREGYQNIQAPGGECNGTGGWNGERPPPDCGLRTGSIGLQLGWGPAYGSAGDPKKAGNALTLSGPYRNFAPGVDFEAGSDPIGHTYQNCPFFPTGDSASVDQLIAGGDKLSVSKLAKLKKGKSLKLSGSGAEPEANGDLAGETVTAWNMKIKRVG